jgi:hypothetical protein
VKKMKDIFQKAERVIVWLGPEGNNSTLALGTLDILVSKITRGLLANFFDEAGIGRMPRTPLGQLK